MTEEQYQDFINCQAKVYRYARSLTKDTNCAEDIYQDILLKLWELKDHWHKWDSFEAYAMGMVRNAYLNKVKKDGRYYLLPVEEAEDIIADNTTENKINLEDLSARFQAVIGRLPAIQREILHLREIEEMGYKEIAAVLELNEAQVKVYLFRARQFLKNRYYGRK